MAKEAMRVWWIPQVGAPVPQFYFDVDSLVAAKQIVEALARYDLFQYKHRIKPDYANMGGLEVFRNGDWEEWEDEEANNIDDITLEQCALLDRAALEGVSDGRQTL